MSSLIKPAILTLMMSVAPFAEKNESEFKPAVSEKSSEIGIRYSNLTGYGVSYQKRFFDHNYIRLTGWFKYYEYLKGEEKDPIELEKNNNYNIGIDYQRNIIEEERYRVFFFMGGGYAVVEKIKEHQRDSLRNPSNLENSLITAGIGGGIEYRIAKNLSADLGISYKFDYDLTKDVHYKDAITNEDKYADELRKETGLGINVGLNVLF
jgi:hypothetical protein